MEKAIKWSYKVEFTGADEANVIMTANLFHHFHLFSLKHDIAAYDFTGTPTAINFTPNSNYKLIGKVRESKPVAGSDEIGSYIWHENKAVFTQKIKLLNKKEFEIAFSVSWQICNDVMCHMPQVDNKKILVSESKNTTSAVENIKNEEEIKQNTVEVETTEVTSGKKNIRGTCQLAEEAEEMPVSIGIRGRMIDSSQYDIIYVLKGDENWKTFSGKNNLFKNVVLKINSLNDVKLIGDIHYPETKTYYDSIYKKKIAYYPVGSKFIQRIKVPHGKQPVIKGYVQFNAASSEEYFTSENIEYTYSLSNAKLDVNEEGETRSYWGLFIIAFLAGFTALLTPCVFPMIPMTVSFFLKQSKDRKTGIKNAMIYGLSIIVIYITLGLGVTIVFGSDALNAMSTNVYFNVIFFLLLLVFGASFLGAFEIKMPSSWVNKADSKADKGGLIGIFFMAFTLSLVSFSCTGPIIGTLLVSTSDGLMGPFIGMLGFSLALALPFTLFAIFPGMLNQMPQSGGWLNSVKVVLGFLEIALAFKFLSNADLVVQAHLLEREVFLAFWVIIFLLLGLYLLGKLKFSHDSDLPFISVGRLFMSITVFSFVMYMIPGLWGSPLKILSGFLPPQNYSEIPYGIGGSTPKHALPEHAHHGPHGIPVFHDYEHAKAHADAINKPLMIDFTGHACINCRKMEDQVWSQDFVKELLVDSVVVVSLHVDEKLALAPKDYIKDENGKTLKSVGEKWSYMQRTRFGQQTQPQYILLDKEEQKLSPSTTYSTDSEKIKNFKKWLDDGIEEYYARLNLQTLKGSLLIKPKSCVSPTNTQTYDSMFEELYGEKYAF
jgi:thiol:disulfide interchange protein